MDRARLATLNALSLLLLTVSLALAVSGQAGVDAPGAAAAVSWPVSSLLLAEVQTGGASASDEFVELTNASAATVDLAGLEVVYVTSTGGTVTRKASWVASQPLEPGQHLLVANASGLFASIADVTYSGGFAATGGTLVLRAIGGAPVDAIGWGDATNAFVEGSAATAPAAGSSLERLPGGIAGNTSDTNDNATDWFVQATPSPQNLAAPPVPAPGASATPAASPMPTASPLPSGSAAPTDPAPTDAPTPAPTSSPSESPAPLPTGLPSPSPSASPVPTVEPTHTPTPAPTPTATASPSQTAAPTSTPSATPAPTDPPSPEPTASPSPDPAVISIDDARALPIDAAATVEGTATTALGGLESGHVGFVEDASAGIAVYLESIPAEPWPAGTVVRLTGRIDERYGARTIRVGLADVVTLGVGSPPEALVCTTGSIGEEVEGRRVAVSGLTVGSASSLADGTAIIVDDGSGGIRVIVSPAALGDASIPAGMLVEATGPVGQRDSTGSGTSGYRIHATEPGTLRILPPEPSPTPSPAPTSTPAPTSSTSPSPAPSDTPTPSVTPGPSASPTPTPTPEPATLDVATARSQPVGTQVRVAGVVTAEAGRLGLPPLLAIIDEGGGLPIRLADGMVAPPRGTAVIVDGPLAAPYGQLELRVVSGGFAIIGPAAVPAPISVAAADLGEAIEGRLVEIEGTLASRPTRATSGDIGADAFDAAGNRFRIMADASSGLTAASLSPGQAYRLVGIVGQRASRKGALDGYRIWLRDAGDVRETGIAAAPPAEVVSPIAEAIRREGAEVAIEATVTAGPTLLDASGRRVVVADASGAIEVLVPAGTSVARGDRIRVAGTVGRAWGAPRLAADVVTVLGSAATVPPELLAGAPGPAHEWRLVRISGPVLDVRRLGTTWRAELLVGRERVVVVGLAGAGIASTALVEGRPATVVGIVRRPYPTATDRRYQVLPRGPGDVSLGPPGSGSATRRAAGAGRPDVALPGGGAPASPIDVDLATLGDHVAELVRVGGLIVEPTADGFRLDDATAVARIALRGEAAAYATLLEPGEALNAIGRVERDGGELIVAVLDPAGLIRVGGLGQALPLGAPVAATGPAAAPAAPAGPTLAGTGGLSDEIPIGVSGLVAIAILSVALTLVRRRAAASRVAIVARARIADLGRDDGSA